MAHTNTAHWDRLLTEAVTLPGTPDADPYSLDAPAFVWERWNTPTWAARQAFEHLGVMLLPFPEQLSSRFFGFATGACIGLNPRTRRKVRTAAHELAHVLLRHTENVRADEGRIPVEEFEAECVALLVTFTLGADPADLADSRHYIQHHATQPCSGPLPSDWTAIKRAASAILAAGAGRHYVAPEPKPLDVTTDARGFAARLNWHSK